MIGLNRQELQDFERKVDFVSIIESNEASMRVIKQELPDQVFNYATLCATNYLEMCFPGQISLAPVIASDLIATRDDWRAADILNFFKFIRQRQDLEGIRVFGNTITIPKLMEMVSVYEYHRADAIERHQYKQKGEIAERDKKLNALAEKVAQKFKDKDVVLQDFGMGKQLEKTISERERTGKDVSYRKEAPDEKFFDKINSGK